MKSVRHIRKLGFLPSSFVLPPNGSLCIIMGGGGPAEAPSPGAKKPDVALLTLDHQYFEQYWFERY